MDLRLATASLCILCDDSSFAMLGATHRRYEPVAVEGARRIADHDLAIAHDDDPVAREKDFAQQMGDQDTADSLPHDAPHEGEQLAGPVSVE
jgi:hypothetical protein